MKFVVECEDRGIKRVVETEGTPPPVGSILHWEPEIDLEVTEHRHTMNGGYWHGLTVVCVEVES